MTTNGVQQMWLTAVKAHWRAHHIALQNKSLVSGSVQFFAGPLHTLNILLWLTYPVVRNCETHSNYMGESGSHWMDYYIMKGCHSFNEHNFTKLLYCSQLVVSIQYARLLMTFLCVFQTLLCHQFYTYKWVVDCVTHCALNDY